eukprot:4133291-Alexandrium_andersonii.AAC.1
MASQSDSKVSPRIARTVQWPYGGVAFVDPAVMLVLGMPLKPVNVWTHASLSNRAKSRSGGSPGH